MQQIEKADVYSQLKKSEGRSTQLKQNMDVKRASHQGQESGVDNSDRARSEDRVQRQEKGARQHST